jgi:hypothetical protein
MKKFVAVLFLLLCATTLQAKDKPNPADFNIKIHISASRVQFDGTAVLVFADTVLNGRKVQLAGTPPGPRASIAYWAIAINPGDYQIRLKKDESEKDGSIIRQEYELLLPNGETWGCYLIGISE